MSVVYVSLTLQRLSIYFQLDISETTECRADDEKENQFSSWCWFATGLPLPLHIVKIDCQLFYIKPYDVKPIYYSNAIAILRQTVSVFALWSRAKWAHAFMHFWFTAGDEPVFDVQ